MGALELIERDEPAAVAPPPQRELSVIEHAIRSGATPEQMQTILELQVRADNHKLEMMREKRRMDEEDRAAAAARAFDAAMTQFRGKNIVVPKTKQVTQRARSGGDGPSFKQSEFDVVCSMISPALSEAGLSFRHDMKFGAKDWLADGSNPAVPAGTPITVTWVYVTCILTHKDGHSETLTLEGPPDTSGAKNPLQEMQSTASYLKRQSLLAITGTATGGEDDENKLRGRGAKDAADADGDADEAVLQAGRDAAMSGMDALTAWWGNDGPLTAKQRNKFSKDYPELRRTAQLADQKGAKQ